MSKFVSEKLNQVLLGDGEWVKIPIEISFQDCENFVTQDDSAVFEQTLDLLMHFVKEWNFKDDEKNDVPLTRDNMKRLKINIISKIQEEIFKLMPDTGKKKPGKE